MLCRAASKANLFKLMQCLCNVMQHQSCQGNKDLIRKTFHIAKNMFNAIFACKCYTLLYLSKTYMQIMETAVIYKYLHSNAGNASGIAVV